MKRNYQFQSGKTGKSQNKGQVLLVLMAFATGYLSSTIMSMSQLESWLNNSLSYFSWYSSPKKSIVQAKNETPERTPKLEFYTVLTKADQHVLPPQAEKAVVAQASIEQNKKIAQAEQALEIANQLSKDKLLPPVEVAAASKPTQVKSASPIKNAYVVQLASFRYYSQAEKFKAKLILKGFDVKISAIRQGTMQWYRVMLGPYASLSEAQKAKLIFQAKEHAPGMVRQMDA
jgi:hypothetical protein